MVGTQYARSRFSVPRIAPVRFATCLATVPTLCYGEVGSSPDHLYEGRAWVVASTCSLFEYGCADVIFYHAAAERCDYFGSHAAIRAAVSLPSGPSRGPAHFVREG